MSDSEQDPSEDFDLETMREYSRQLAHQLRIMLCREAALRVTAEYLSRMLDENSVNVDEHYTRFLARLSSAMSNGRPLEHLEADVEVLQYALKDRKES